MLPTIDTRKPGEVEGEVASIYHRLYLDGKRGFVATAFGWLEDCFAGRYDDYQPVDTRYHDWEHTLQGTLCLVRLLEGRHLAGALPAVNRPWFELGLLAILFHDTGYLKKRDDRSGTGAKYTMIHVARSVAFARDLLAQRGYSASEITSIQNMIRCTGIDVNLAVIPFGSELERVVGAALGTADLLGQMAAPDYVDKLPILYQEFAEAARSCGQADAPVGAFASAEELVRKTPSFWGGHVWPRIQNDFGGLHAYLNDPYPDGENLYLRRIAENLARIQQRYAAG